MGTGAYQASFAGNPVPAGAPVPRPEETRQESRIGGQFAERTHGLGARCHMYGVGAKYQRALQRQKQELGI